MLRTVFCKTVQTAQQYKYLAFGARVVGIELAKMIIDEWLGAEFEGGRHQTRVDMIMAIENKDN